VDIKKNIIIYFFGKLVPAAANIVFMVAGMRLLGKAAYGEFNLQFSSIMIISSLGVGWLQQSVLRFLPGVQESSKGHGYLYLTFFCAFGVAVISAIFGFFYFHLTGINLILYTVFSWLISLFAVQLTLLQASFEPSLYAFAESSFYLLTIIFLLSGILLFDRHDPEIYFIALVIALLLVESGYLLYPRIKNKLTFYTNPGKKQTFSYLQYGFPLTVWIMISNLYNLVDRFFIHHFSGYENVGLYSSVYDLVFKAAGFLSLPVLLTFHPAIANAWNENDINKGKGLIKKSMFWEAAILLLLFSFLYPFLPFLLDKLFKIHDANVTALFIPLAISASLWQLVLLMQKPLEFSNRRNMMIGGILCAVIVNAILNAILIPRYGYEIAAWTTLTCTMLYFLIIAFAVTVHLKKFSTPIVS
jgi:O-antigen/teichoic acid export membrane protein